MKLNILLIGLVILMWAGCKRKPTNDYQYYKPYQKDSIAVDTLKLETDTITMHEAEAIIEVKGVDLKDRFIIVVASYSMEEFALEQKKELQRQGYKPEVFMLNEDGWYKLGVESHATYIAAKDALAILKNKEGLFTNAVIVQNK